MLSLTYYLYFFFFWRVVLQMEKFTGADLTEICQRAAKIAIRENIMKVGEGYCSVSAQFHFVEIHCLVDVRTRLRCR